MENYNSDLPMSSHVLALDTLQGEEGPPGDAGIDGSAFTSPYPESNTGQLAQPAEVTSVVINELVRVEE